MMWDNVGWNGNRYTLSMNHMPQFHTEAVSTVPPFLSHCPFREVSFQKGTSLSCSRCSPQKKIIVPMKHLQFPHGRRIRRPTSFQLTILAQHIHCSWRHHWYTFILPICTTSSDPVRSVLTSQIFSRFFSTHPQLFFGTFLHVSLSAVEEMSFGTMIDRLLVYAPGFCAVDAPQQLQLNQLREGQRSNDLARGWRFWGEDQR